MIYTPRTKVDVFMLRYHELVCIFEVAKLPFVFKKSLIYLIQSIVSFCIDKPYLLLYRCVDNLFVYFIFEIKTM